jgi:hypothetical protein
MTCTRQGPSIDLGPTLPYAGATFTGGAGSDTSMGDGDGAKVKQRKGLWSPGKKQS